MILITIALSIGILVIWIILKNKIKHLKQELKKTNSSLKSAYVRFGKTFEHFVPFANNFPGDKEKFIFLGMPIDGLIFEEDKIKFIEIKTGASQLSQKQKRIKKQIENGAVEFVELRY